MMKNEEEFATIDFNKEDLNDLKIDYSTVEIINECEDIKGKENKHKT
jgi:hypothetical protein